MYLNLDDTKAKKARARNGAPAECLDFDTRGKKYGQLAAVCTGGFFAQYVYPCDVRSTTYRHRDSNLTVLCSCSERLAFTSRVRQAGPL